MVAQDTGSAITGPARADIYYGAGPDAGRVSGRFRHNMRFVILVPKSLDPVSRGRKMPLPDPRPMEKIARLFPQVDPLKDKPKDQKNGAKPSDTSVAPNPKNAVSATEPAKNAPAPPPPAGTAQAAAGKVPLPEARPDIKPSREGRHYRRVGHYRRSR
jgi:membrane-bound lytic murein transglycosylase A